MRSLLTAILVLTGMIALPCAAQANPDTLWHIVHDRCVPDMQQNARPAPCAAVHPDDTNGTDRGWIVLKDIEGVSQFLVIPTRKLTGIESPELLETGAPNYFSDAWEQRSRVEAALGKTLPRDDIALAINSKLGRSQNQLHIHIDCLRTDIRDLLHQYRDQIGTKWQRFPVDLAGHRYDAIRIMGETLTANPFQLDAARLAHPAEDMGRQTLVLAGAQFSRGPGFILLAGEARLLHADTGSGEELQDHACKLAQTY